MLCVHTLGTRVLRPCPIELQAALETSLISLSQIDMAMLSTKYDREAKKAK